MTTDNRLAKYVLLYAGTIALATLVFAHFSEKEIADKAVTVLNNVALSAVTGILGYLTAKNDAYNDEVSRYDDLLEDYERLRKELESKHKQL